MKKIERLLAIVLALKNKGKMIAAGLADFLEVNIRTIYRDIDALSQMNIPITALPGKDGGYDILDDYFMQPVQFSKDEILTLSVARELVLDTQIPGFDPYIHSAFLKIQSNISREDENRINMITGRILYDLNFIAPEMEGKDYFPLIKEAFDNDKCLVIGYYSLKSQLVKEYLVNPYLLIFTDGVWYLRGESENKPFLWWFRLDRIKYIKLSDENNSLPENFDKNTYRFSENIERSGKESDPQICRIKMSRILYETVCDDVLFKRASFKIVGDSYVVEILTDRYETVFQFLFRNYDSAQLIGPETLKREYSDRLKKILSTC